MREGLPSSRPNPAEIPLKEMKAQLAAAIAEIEALSARGGAVSPEQGA
ncbi:MAG TPA: hypothetical protein VHB93_00525 [Candidatus Paceibacterota bacterium]|nr:hypothetical protein [Candidatus Paceibacterota bacterium]